VQFCLIFPQRTLWGKFHLRKSECCFTLCSRLVEGDSFSHLVNFKKVARVMAPSVIQIDDIEKLFTKRKKKDNMEEDDTILTAKILRRRLVWHIKGMKAGERILIVGTTRNPQG